MELEHNTSLRLYNSFLWSWYQKYLQEKSLHNRNISETLTRKVCAIVSVQKYLAVFNCEGVHIYCIACVIIIILLVSPVVARAAMLFFPRPTLFTANTPNSYSVYGLMMIMILMIIMMMMMMVIMFTQYPSTALWSPESSNVIEVGDGSTDLLVIPRGRLRLVLDHVVLHVAVQDKNQVGLDGETFRTKYYTVFILLTMMLDNDDW